MADFMEIVKKHAGEDGNIPASAINTLVTAIRNTVGNEYVEKERYKEKLTEIDTLKADKQTAEDSATTAEKWKVKYEAAKKDFSDFKAEQAKKDTRAAKENAYRELLKEAGVSEKRIEAVLKVSDVDGVELTDKGEIKGADKLTASIRGPGRTAPPSPRQHRREHDDQRTNHEYQGYRRVAQGDSRTP